MLPEEVDDLIVNFIYHKWREEAGWHTLHIEMSQEELISLIKCAYAEGHSRAEARQENTKMNTEEKSSTDSSDEA